MLMFGKRFVRTGSRFTVTYKGADYDLELTDIDGTNFTLRYNREEITRPVKTSKVTMRTRIYILTAMLVMLVTAVSARAPDGRPDFAAPKSVMPAAVTGQDAPSSDVQVKDSSPNGAATAKTKDVSGNETLSVDFPTRKFATSYARAELFDLNLVIPDTLQGEDLLKLHDVTWHQISRSSFRPSATRTSRTGNIIKDRQQRELTQERGLHEIFVINYAKAADIMPTLGLARGRHGGRQERHRCGAPTSLVITERPSR